MKIMRKKVIEELRDRVGCAALLQQDSWKLDLKESTRRAIKYRHAANIVIVIHGDRGWFDPLAPAKGDVFDLARHLGAQGFAQACDHVASLIGFVPSPEPWQRDIRGSSHSARLQDAGCTAACRARVLPHGTTLP